MAATPSTGVGATPLAGGVSLLALPQTPLVGAAGPVRPLLTKRNSLMQKFVNQRYRDREAPRHIWFGVSVEMPRPFPASRICKRRAREFASYPSNLS